MDATNGLGQLSAAANITAVGALIAVLLLIITRTLPALMKSAAERDALLAASLGALGSVVRDESQETRTVAREEGERTREAMRYNNGRGDHTGKTDPGRVA